MTQIKARKVTASNMTTPVTVQQRVRVNDVWGWQDVLPLLYCEFHSVEQGSVNTGMMTIGAWKHTVFTRFMPVLAPGQRLYNAVENKYYYVQAAGDVEHVRQWTQMTALEVNFDPAMALNIRRPVSVKGTYREESESFTDIADNVPALFGEPNATALSIYASRVGGLDVYAVGVPLDTDVRTSDTLQLVSTGEEFKVHAVRAPQSFATMLTLLVGRQS